MLFEENYIDNFFPPFSFHNILFMLYIHIHAYYKYTTSIMCNNNIFINFMSVYVHKYLIGFVFVCAGVLSP